MEERLIDREREIKIKRKQEGDEVLDPLAEEGASADEAAPEEEEELVFELPEDEYDEDLVGLTPSQLKEELARREKARQEAEEECAKLVAEGQEKLQAGEYASAEEHFLNALVYDGESVAAGIGLWKARTKDYSELDAFYVEENVERFYEQPEEVKSAVYEGMGEALAAAEKEAEEEAAPLRKSVAEDMERRRAPFLANRKYYLVRFIICLGLFGVMLLGVAISAGFIYSTRSPLPIYLSAGFGGGALIVLVAVILLMRKLVVAQRLCRANETLSSTEDGARLEELEQKLYCLALVLHGPQEEEGEEESEE